MPKVTQKANRTTSTMSDLFVFKYGSKRVMAKRQPCYRTAIQTCQSLFPALKDCNITFNTKDLDVCENEMTVISEESWKTAITQLNCVVVMVEEQGDPTRVVAVSGSATGHVREERIKIFVMLSDGRSFWYKVLPSSPISELVPEFSARFGECANDYRFLFDGSVLERTRTFKSYNFMDHDTIDCMKDQIGGKPVIYLFSPTLKQVSVKLSLCPQWEFSAIYPVVPVKPRTESSNQEISWKVESGPDGNLKELTTGIDVSYLFWEAHTNPDIAPPSASSVTKADDIFYPNRTDLTETDSVVLPVDKITPYLDKALAALCLHTEARTSFITYWLPSFLRHKYVALRFVPQKSYEHAAPLAVSPAPDVITRIFMVFKGIAEDELDQWSAATRRAASGDVEMWKTIVGVDSERAHDAKLFRVLEWGGMEVLEHATL